MVSLDPGSLDGAGTPEATWQDWPVPGGWPALSGPGPDEGPPLIVAPHPDDEVLGAGGLIARLAGESQVEIVAVTDGEASHPRSTVLTPAALAAIRRLETDNALRALGATEPVVHRLGHPDGGVSEERLTAELSALLRPGRWCVATWRGDGHPDHEAVGRAAARACADTGARLLEYPVWTWHWAVPDDPRVPWGTARRLDLTPAERAAKKAAIATFTSQTEPLGPGADEAPILPPHVLARFDRTAEVYFL